MTEGEAYRALKEGVERNGDLPLGDPPSSAKAVALGRFRAARRASELDLFMAILDFDGADTHWRIGAAALWKQHTRIGGYRLSLHAPLSAAVVADDRTQCTAKLGQAARSGAAGAGCCQPDLSPSNFTGA